MRRRPGGRIHDMPVNRSVIVRKIAFIAAGGNDRLILHPDSAQITVALRILDTDISFLAIRFRSDRLDITSKTEQRACHAVLLHSLYHLIPGKSLSDAA